MRVWVQFIRSLYQFASRGGVTVIDDGIHGWNVSEIRDAVFRQSEERAESVRADAMERAHRIADLLKARYSASAVTL